MLKSGPVIRAFSESQSIFKVDVIRKEEEEETNRQKRRRKRIKIFCANFTPTLFAFSSLIWRQFLPLSCLRLNCSYSGYYPLLFPSSPFPNFYVLLLLLYHLPLPLLFKALKCQCGTSGWQAAPSEQAPSMVLLQCEDRLKEEEEVSEWARSAVGGLTADTIRWPEMCC